ncbi:MAG TPA: sigma 54-interacting transcriptional regulator [Polyangiales bacterium]|nr:sigma 54-interacting transcriptional regulator [Polyangiales bacterium]
MRTMARYRFLRRLGAGAAGGVYLVEDRVLGGPPLALKRVERASDPAFRDSYAREFAVLASLSVPGVARVHDLGVAPARDEIPEGPFFTRDFIDGVPLSTWGRARSVDEVVRVFLRVLSTCAALHRSFVLHGDLHPGNVIVDAQGMAHLIDFGLASRGADVLHGSGTPIYMAPELLQGGGSTMSADIYALAATLWTALTGAPPWSGERALAAKLAGELPRIEVEDARVRRVLEACTWALARDPRSRAPSVDELAAKIELASGIASERVAHFAPPRPRGRDALLDQLTALGQGFSVLHGARGMGKSTLLRELKWRLQLAGREVIALHCGDFERPALEQLARQLGTTEERAPSVLAERACLLLVDDLDAADGQTMAVLRGAPALLASSESTAIDAQLIAVPALPAETMRALIADALGPIEAASEARLLAHAAGNPGVLLEALEWAWQRGDVSALGELASGEIAASLAERRAAGVGRELLTLLALARAPLPESLLQAVLGQVYPEARRCVLERGLAHVELDALHADDDTVSEYLRQTQSVGLALRALATGVADPVARAELAIASGERARMREHVPPAVHTLRARGASTHALRLCDAGELWLDASELCAELGEYARAAELAEGLLEDESTEVAARARVAAGRAHVAASRLDRAVELLASMPTSAPVSLRAQAARELARAYLRRGEFEQARAAVRGGLAVAASDEPARIELLAIDASLPDQVEAEARYAEALTLARALGATRDAALVLGYRAFAHERRGALEPARADYEAALAEARKAGDLGQSATYALNLGNVCMRAGQLESVENHYTLAGRLARRTGRLGTALSADNHQAELHVRLGSFARARQVAEASLAEAERLGHVQAEAHALSTLGDIDARSGAAEPALARYEAAAVRYRKLGRNHELAWLWLDAAEVLFERGGMSDVSAAAGRVAQARELIERHGHDDLRPRLRLLVARGRAGHGDLDGAVRELAELERSLDVERDRELLWQVLGAQASMHLQLGAPLLASRKAREAAELIELLASQVPRNAREAFCGEPRRAAVLELARERSTERRDEGSRRGLDDPRFTRLLELIKRLARERDLTRLLERITDAAVDLSGAERGFVLLTTEQGQLAPHTVRASGGAEVDPHVAFSRSIAEAVLIDGEPIVTVNARDDRRLNEYMSVHKLMLKSVACIPISGPSGVLGVLYLEHRLRAGRFQEDDIDLLVAFADQAAIALENARLWSENERRRCALELQARELAAAKVEIERVLEARTEELELTRLDLGRARAELAGQVSRHGIVGQSASMRRVFALIERVADSPVPIVVEGESGTGKELVARAIHASGARKKEPFVAINCAALPEQLLESELFGHVRGAFTGAERDKKGLFTQAEGGTIFLDEFADMPARMQIDLLRVLQERRIRPLGADADIPVDVRIIAASNRPLKQLVASGRLREDLYYRMSVVEIKLPALRERPEDIPLLCDHLLTRAAERSGSRPRKLSRAALESLLSCPLPGNVRQLEHLLASAAMLAEGPQIEPQDLGLDGGEEAEELRPSTPPLDDDLVGTPDDVQGFKTRERKRIIEALEKHGWNRAKAATALGMPRRTFYRRLSEFNIL